MATAEIAPMRYRIIKDMPGYLRLRYGANAFTKEEGYGIADRLQRVLGVATVKTTPSNGGVLVCYDANYQHCKARVLEALSEFDRMDLPTVAASDEQLKYEIDNQFAVDLAKKTAGYLFRRFVLPSFISRVWTVFRSIKFIVRGIQHLIKPELSVQVLDMTAITASLLRGSFKSAGEIMFLLDISDLLEEYTHARSRVQLEQSLAMDIDQVWLVTEDGDVTVPLETVRPGDVIRVRTGSLIPVDGEVVEGEAAVNEASMTGESALVVKKPESTVYAGTAIDEGSIAIKVRNAGSNTRISQIVDLVDQSEQLKAGIQGKAERLADAIVPFSFLGFLAVLAITRSITKALSVILVDYSCAIKLSTPVAVMSALREAAARGMVVKGGRYFEVMAEADTIVFDKTGTLTSASPRLERVIAFGEKSEEEYLRIAACLEEHFPHSVANAVVAGAKEMGISHDDELHAEVKYVVAHGIASELDGKTIYLGSEHFVFEDEGVEDVEGREDRIASEAPGCSVIYLAIDHKLEAALCIADTVREEAADVIARLREAGFVHIVMLTGDAENSARVVAQELGITEYRSQVLPEDKASIVQEYRDAGHTVVMVGDGINDSPALAVADASVAMVDASDIAREVADISLLNASLEEILTVRKISTALMCRISADYRFIVAFNTSLIVLGVAGVLPNTTSALLHNLSTMAITAGNMRKLLPQQEGRNCRDVEET